MLGERRSRRDAEALPLHDIAVATLRRMSAVDAETVPAEKTFYRSRVPWQLEPSGSLVVCCSDGRFHGAALELASALQCDASDVLASPGGPATLLLSASFFFAERAKLQMLAAAHRTRRIVAIAHADCAYYAAKYPDLDEMQRTARQEADLATFRTEVSRLCSAEVETFYAEPVEGFVHFRRIP